MSKKKVAIIGASGYTGGELLRWALLHPEMEVMQITSERFAGQAAYKLNPNLRGFTQLAFVPVKELKDDIDAVFICTPHKAAAPYVKRFLGNRRKNNRPVCRLPPEKQGYLCAILPGAPRSRAS